MIRVAAYWNDRRKELLPHEVGAIYKVDVDVTIALCFTNSYAVGMSNLGFHTAYWYFNLPENVKAERAFFEQNAQPLTLESGRPLSAFPLVGFSINFELDYLNFLRMIHLSRIPVFREQRTENHPLIFIGGFMTYFNIRPLIPFIDFAFMGDSEELFVYVNAVLIRSVREGWKREALLRRLARIDGIFVPQFSEKATPQIIEDLNTFETVSRIISPHTEFKNMFLIEIVRGCFHQCNFCIAGHAYGPPRVRDVTHVIAACF